MKRNLKTVKPMPKFKPKKTAPKAKPKRKKRAPVPVVFDVEEDPKIEEIIPDLVIPLPEPAQGPEPTPDAAHPVVRVDLRIDPTLFGKLRKLSARARTALNIRIVDFITEAVDTLEGAETREVP